MPILDAIDAGKKWPRGSHLLPILAVASIGFTVAVAAWVVVSIWEGRLARATFANVAGDYPAVLQNGLDRNLAEMTVMRAFYDSSIEVDSDEFEVFTNRILEGQTSMMRITWSPASRAASSPPSSSARRRSASRATRSGIGRCPDHCLKRQSGRNISRCSTRPPSSRSVLGVDLGSEAARRDAIERAIDGDRIATAPNIELRHNGDAEWRGFFVAVPVYRRNVPNDTPEQRRANTLGILSGTFQTAGVIESILSASSLPDDVNLYLFAADARPNDLPKFLRSPQARADMGPQTQALPPTNIGPGNSEPATRAGPWSSPPSITALPETWMPFDPRLLG